LSSKANTDTGQVARTENSRLFADLRISRYPLWAIVLFAVLFHAASVETAWAQSTVDEYRVKAAFLFHFAQLVEWPADSPNEGGNSLYLCTLGDDPFHGELESTIAGKQIGPRILRIRHARALQDARGCDVLFISKSEGSRTASLLANLRNTPVLTVGDDDGFVGAGGIIRMFLEGNKVRFEINRQAAESARLRISSQLLLLARNAAGGSGRK
jgi:hypothetical protein